MKQRFGGCGWAAIICVPSKSTSGDESSGRLMYFSSVSMALRNPMLIRWSSYIEECLEFFAASSAILPSDAWLCHLVRNQHIAEDVAILFSMDDPASIVSLSDPKIKFLLRSFEQRLENWKSQAAKLDVPQGKYRSG
jgi:hypothetical protein